MKAISSFMKRELTFKPTRRQADNWLPKGCRSFDEGFWTRKRGVDKQGLRPQPGCLARVTAVIVTLPYRDEQMCFFILSVLSDLSISCPSPPPSTLHLHLRLIVCNHAPLQSFPPALLSSSPTVHTTSTPATSTLAVYISRQLHADL